MDVFYFQGIDLLHVDAAAECLLQIQNAPVIIVDSLAEHAYQVGLLLEKLIESKSPFYFVGAERTSRMDRVRAAFVGLPKYSVPQMKPLNTAESIQLVKALRGRGLLGHTAKYSDQELARRAEGNDLLVALCEIASGKWRLSEILESEWDNIKDQNMRRLLAMVSIAYSFEIPVKLGVVQGQLREDVGKIRKAFGSGVLSGIVVGVGFQGEYLRVKHRIIAEHYVSEIIGDDMLFDCYVMLSNGISKYVNRATIRNRTMEARLAAKLMDYDPSVRQRLKDRVGEFYSSIKYSWEWNSRYWEQVALFEFGRNLHRAIQYARTAAGIEEHPYTFATLGNILLRGSVHETVVGQQSRDMLEEGIEFLRKSIILTAKWRIPNVRPYYFAIDGSIRYCRKYPGQMPSSTIEWIDELLRYAEKRFPFHLNWSIVVRNWSEVSSGEPRRK